MALKTVDLTQQPHRAIFLGCSQEEVSYAKTFWQSLQLLPPMESRLVSSDIKQRLRKAPPSRSMSECVTMTEEFDTYSDFQHFVTHSDSSEGETPFESKSLNRPGSLRTQTSFVPNFGESGDEVDMATSDSKGRVRNYEEPSHGRKISLSAPGLPGDGSQGTGNRPWVFGAGGREFWSQWPVQEGAEGDSYWARTIEPFSGEDLCRRKGFINWGEQVFLSKQPAIAVECGGEELQRGRQSNSSTQNSDAKQQHAPKSTPHQNKKRQRVVGSQQVTSLFKSNNIQPESMYQSLFNPSNIMKQYLQPVLRVVPDKFRKFIGPSRRDDVSSATTRSEKETTTFSSEATRSEKETTTFSSEATRSEKDTTTSGLGSERLNFPVQSPQGKKDKSKTKTQSSSLKSSKEHSRKSEASVMSGIDVKKKKLIGVPRDAGTPTVYTRPSKDLVYWTLGDSNYTTGRHTVSQASHLRDFFVRAKTMENIEEYRKLRKFASARDEDRELLHKHRAWRIKREEISRRVNSSSVGSQPWSSASGLSALSRDGQDVEDELLLDDRWSTDVRDEILKFEKLKGNVDAADSEEEK